MTSNCIDLHIHTTASDGSFTPAEIVCLAKEAGLQAIAITDHDSIDGVTEIIENKPSHLIDIIPGIELSVDYDTEMHLLGYFIDIKSKELIQDLKKIKSQRFSEVRDYFTQMKSHHIRISPEEIIKTSGFLSKYNIASYLIKKGHAKNLSDAFGILMNTSAPIKKRLAPYEAISVIKKAGGLCFLAHPNSLKKSSKQIEQIMDDLAAHGLDGVECYHPDCSFEEQKMYLDIAKSRGLLVSGGSDFHGKIKPDIQLGSGYGDLSIPSVLLEKMRKRIEYKKGEVI